MQILVFDGCMVADPRMRLAGVESVLDRAGQVVWGLGSGFLSVSMCARACVCESRFPWQCFSLHALVALVAWTGLKRVESAPSSGEVHRDS